MSKSAQCLTQIATYLKVAPGKITFDLFTQPIRSHNNISIKGFLNIILTYLNESKCDLVGKSLEDEAEVYQWIEYGEVYLLGQAIPQVINDLLPGLNEVLSKRTYLASNNLTIADVTLYYMLLSVMENISYIEKEKYVNISRWYDNLQQDDCLRQKHNFINFNTSFLSTIAPARH